MEGSGVWGWDIDRRFYERGGIRDSELVYYMLCFLVYILDFLALFVNPALSGWDPRCTRVRW